LFYLDERIQSSCIALADWSLSRVLLKNDQNYPWFLLVPRKNDVQEIYQLTLQEQMLLMQEINQLSLLIKDYYQPKKINIASLGNIVEQLHIHCVARSECDSLWPHGIWQPSFTCMPYTEEQLNTVLPVLKDLLSPARG
jgi:diadenosine tetraphosphate (Ap4A) HIT family hydrolase